MPLDTNNTPVSVLNQWNFRGMTPRQRLGGVVGNIGNAWVIGVLGFTGGASGLLGSLPAIAGAVSSELLFSAGYYSLGSAFASAATFLLRASSMTLGNDPLKSVLAVQAGIVGAGAFLYPLQRAAMAAGSRFPRLSKLFNHTAAILPTTIGATNALVIRPVVMAVSGKGESWGMLSAQGFFVAADLLKGNISEHLKAIKNGYRATIYSVTSNLPKCISSLKAFSVANDNDHPALLRPEEKYAAINKANDGPG